MELEQPKRTLDSLSDEEIESCFEGTTNLDLVRRLLRENQAPDGWIWSIDFGHEFADAIENFIGEDPGTPEWDQAWDNNAEWGEIIADNVNNLLAEDE